MKQFKNDVIEDLKKHIEDVKEDTIEFPPDSSLGDLAFPCFTLAKQWRMSPAEIAGTLSQRIEVVYPFERIESKGPYLNFFIKGTAIAELVLQEDLIEKETDIKRIMIEYSSPNTNKPLHLGHLRNIILGSTVSTIEKSLGNHVVQSCLVNDRGIHICKSMLMYMKYGSEPDKKPDYYVGDFYVMFNNEVEKHPELNDEAQELLRKWEAGEPEVVKVWEKMNRWANQGFQETYDKLGIEFDKFYYESDIYKFGKEIINQGYEEGRLQKEDGAIIADMEKDNLGKKVLIRSDGTSIYMTQDVFLAKKKFDDFALDSSVYVVGSEQNRHFEQLFRILEILGFDFAKKCYHLSYGMVFLPEGKMKSREGTVVEADQLIDQMHELALEEIKKRHDLDEDELRTRAKTIGLGALKFFLLKTDPAKDVIYDPKQSVSFEGETGPYVQYVYARISSILRKADIDFDEADYDKLDKEEFKLLRTLANFPQSVKEAKRHYRPSIICRYLLDLCQEFNEYYHKVPVLKTEEETKKARLMLLEKIRSTIKEGLGLLRIDVLEEM